MKRQPKNMNRQRSRSLHVESLQSRQLMTTNVLIDFDGISEGDLQTTCDQVVCSNNLAKSWNGGIDGDISGFEDAIVKLNETRTWSDNREFSYENFRYLDLDRDGQLTLTDVDGLKQRIVDRVAEDYSPYDVVVSEMNSTSRALDMMETNAGEDAYILITGAYDDGYIWGGQAAHDEDARVDNAANLGTTWGIAHSVAMGTDLVNNRLRLDAFVNIVANLISHESGHSFGLEHIKVEATGEPKETDPRGSSIMTNAVGKRNTHFANVEYPTEFGGDQNEHVTLLNNLGPSSSSWAQVLVPGELTIHSRPDADIELDRVLRSSLRPSWVINSSLNTGDSWATFTRELGYVNPIAQVHPWDGVSDLNSMNQYGVPITLIRFVGSHGDDWFSIDARITTTAIISGGDGNDILSGGNGQNHILGGMGNDTLIGGDATDYLYGDGDDDILQGGNGSDVIYGGNGNDTLHGEAGPVDRLYGGSGTDTLYGGAGIDYLYGQAGVDWLFGGEGDDVLMGGTETDFLIGGVGYDRLWGEAGDDYLDGGRDDERDQLNGGTGRNLFIDHRRPVFEFDLATGQFVMRWRSEDWLRDFDASDDWKIERDSFI